MAKHKSERFPPPLPDSKFKFQRDLDGFCTSALQKLISHSNEERRKKRPTQNRHPYFRHPGKGHNHDICGSCLLGGNLLCCDICPASFHPECHEPPLEHIDDLPPGPWICHKCAIKIKTEEYKKAEMSKNGGPSSSKDTPGAKDRDQRALERAARRDSAPPENASADNASHEISNSFDSMLREALHSNPETFELPDNLTVRVNLPEHERIPVGRNTARKNPNPKRKDDSKLLRRNKPLCLLCSAQYPKRKSPLIKCDYCSSTYHLDCLNPPLASFPTHSWVCPLHPAGLVEEKLCQGGITEKIKVYDKHVFQPVNEHRVKTNFLRLAPKFKYFPYHRNTSLASANTAQVPESVLDAYRNPQPKEPSSLDFQQAVELAVKARRWLQFHEEQPAPNKKPLTREEQELIVDMQCRLSVDTAYFLLGLNESEETKESEKKSEEVLEQRDDDSESEDDGLVVQVDKTLPHLVNGLANGSPGPSEDSPIKSYIVDSKYASATEAFSKNNCSSEVDQMIFDGGINQMKTQAVKNSLATVIESVQNDIDAMIDEKKKRKLNVSNEACKKVKVSNEQTTPHANGGNSIVEDFNNFEEIQKLQQLLNKMPSESVNLLALAHIMHMQKIKNFPGMEPVTEVGNEVNGQQTEKPDELESKDESQEIQVEIKTERPGSTMDESSRSTTPDVIVFEETRVVPCVITVSPESKREVLKILEEPEEYFNPFVDQKPDRLEGGSFYGRLIPAGENLGMVKSIIISTDVFTIGTGEFCHLRLDLFGECKYVSESHGFIMFDSQVHRLVYHNVSIYGTVVNSVLYGGAAPQESPSKIQSQIDEIKSIRQQRIQALAPPTASNAQESAANPLSQVSSIAKPRSKSSRCSCVGVPKGFSVQPYETMPTLTNGTILRFGCIIFSFSHQQEGGQLSDWPTGDLYGPSTSTALHPPRPPRQSTDFQQPSTSTTRSPRQSTDLQQPSTSTTRSPRQSTDLQQPSTPTTRSSRPTRDPYGHSSSTAHLTTRSSRQNTSTGQPSTRLTRHSSRQNPREDNDFSDEV